MKRLIISVILLFIALVVLMGSLFMSMDTLNDIYFLFGYPISVALGIVGYFTGREFFKTE